MIVEILLGVAACIYIWDKLTPSDDKPGKDG